MKNKIVIDGKIIEYFLKKSKKAKNIRLAMHCDAKIVVTLPKTMSENFASDFILDKASWIFKKLDFFKEKKYLEVKGNYKDNKRKVEDFARTRLAHYNQFYNFKYNKILAKNHKYRWGSCSTRGNLNFNYRILFLPSELADYIIVHELCHLQEMNHSKRFWNLVGKTSPDYRKLVKELRQIAY
ncbi:MAG: SprT family zinc-dependent metalloprotease [bacterium]